MSKARKKTPEKGPAASLALAHCSASGKGGRPRGCRYGVNGFFGICTCAACRSIVTRTDVDRLNWLCDYITSHGTNGFKKLAWTVYDEDGKSLMHRETVSEDEVGDIRFDRSAIDAAMRGPNTKDEPRP